MKTKLKSDTRRQSVGLYLDSELVAKVRGYTNDLSGLVESLLEGYVFNERHRHAAKDKADTTTIVWNDFNARHGSIADEYSTL